MFPVARVGGIIRSVVDPDLRLTKEAPVYLAAVLQYLTEELLALAGEAAHDDNRGRLQPADLFSAVSNDEELNILFRSLKLKNVFGSSFRLPNIHAKLLKKFAFKTKVLRDSIQGVTKPALKRLLRKAGCLHLSGLTYDESRHVLKQQLDKMMRQVITITDSENRKTVSVSDVVLGARSLGIHLLPVNSNKKKPKYPKQRRGAKSAKQKQENILKVIRALQKPNNSMLLIPTTSFQRLAREVGQDYKNGLHYSKDALLLLQTYSESYMVSVFEDALLCALHANRKAIKPSDLSLARILRGEYV